MGNYQEKIFIHVIEKGQTLYSMARFYGLKLDEVYAYNPRLKMEGYRVGDAVRVPIPNRAILRYKTVEFKDEEHVPIMYKVRKGDTFYGISKRYFHMPIEDIMGRNELTEPVLSNGQLLHVGWMSVYGIPDSIRQVRGGPLWQKSHKLKNEYFQKKFNKTEMTESTAAHWNTDEQAGTDLYALHWKAPIGSIISIKNPVYNRTAYVKVIGRVPARVYDKNSVKVIVSPAVARMLGAIDPKFFVELKYLR